MPGRVPKIYAWLFFPTLYFQMTPRHNISSEANSPRQKVLLHLLLPGPCCRCTFAAGGCPPSCAGSWPCSFAAVLFRRQLPPPFSPVLSSSHPVAKMNQGSGFYSDGHPTGPPLPMGTRSGFAPPGGSSSPMFVAPPGFYLYPHNHQQCPTLAQNYLVDCQYPP